MLSLENACQEILILKSKISTTISLSRHFSAFIAKDGTFLYKQLITGRWYNLKFY